MNNVSEPAPVTPRAIRLASEWRVHALGQSAQFLRFVGLAHVDAELHSTWLTDAERLARIADVVAAAALFDVCDSIAWMLTPRLPAPEVSMVAAARRVDMVLPDDAAAAVERWADHLELPAPQVPVTPASGWRDYRSPTGPCRWLPSAWQVSLHCRVSRVAREQLAVAA